MASSVWGGPLAEWRSGGEVGSPICEDLWDGVRISQEGDEGERRLAGGTDQRKNCIEKEPVEALEADEANQETDKEVGKPESAPDSLC
ncbi:MAG: hypothetical protein PVJ76_19620 [Gemmatimonadota bacterium]|jgi:hypothetical protein